MLHARHPVVPPAHAERFAEPIDFDNVDPATRNVRDRAHTARQAGIIAGENLRIAQHQDTLHYATIRGGGYLPSLRQFQEGDLQGESCTSQRCHSAARDMRGHTHEQCLQRGTMPPTWHKPHHRPHTCTP